MRALPFVLACMIATGCTKRAGSAGLATSFGIMLVGVGAQVVAERSDHGDGGAAPMFAGYGAVAGGVLLMGTIIGIVIGDAAGVNDPKAQPATLPPAVVPAAPSAGSSAQNSSTRFLPVFFAR